MSALRLVAMGLVCLICGQAASWGVDYWGGLGCMPGLGLGAALLYWIVPAPPAGGVLEA